MLIRIVWKLSFCTVQFSMQVKLFVLGVTNSEQYVFDFQGLRTQVLFNHCFLKNRIM